MKLNEEGYPEVKGVTLKDRRKLTKLLKGYVNKSGNAGLRNLTPAVKGAVNAATKNKSEEEEITDEGYADLITSVLSNVIEFVNGDVTAWFMSLVNAETIEEFESLPFDTEPYIIEELLKQKGFKNFFLKALDAYKSITN